MEPFFSIIIPTYNRALLIKKAIESVLQQNFYDWELIIVDDGSTDNTRGIVESYSNNRIRYIYQQNAERSEARNNGIKNAQGEYICFLDSDDYFLPNRLSLLFKELHCRNFPIAAFYTGAGIEANKSISIKEYQIFSENIFNHIILAAIHSQQTCIHSTILQEINYDKRFYIGEDTELWLRIADKFQFIYLNNQQTVIVVDQEERSVNVKLHNVYLEYLRTLQYIFSNQRIGNKISKAIKKRMIGNCYFGIAKYLIYNNDRWGAVKNLVVAIVLDFFHFQTKYRLRITLNLLSINGIEKAKQLVF